MPTSTPFLLHLYVALAEKERALSTRDALAAKKAQGKQLGNPKLVAAAIKRGKVLRAILRRSPVSRSAPLPPNSTVAASRAGAASLGAVSVRNAMVRLGFQTTGGAS